MSCPFLFICVRVRGGLGWVVWFAWMGCVWRRIEGERVRGGRTRGKGEMEREPHKFNSSSPLRNREIHLPRKVVQVPE